MIDANLSFALGAGLVAAFNPCGFAMLPAYLSYFLGLESDDETNRGRNVLRGLTVGLTLSAGFVLLFGTIGLLTETLVSSSTIERRTGYVTFAFGLLMVPLGIAMLLGFEPKLRLPRMSKGTGSRQLSSIFLFGVSYGVVSISCTAPIFFAQIISTFSEDSFVDGLAVFLAYAAGMSLVILVLTLSLALARNSIATNMRRVLPYVNRVSGAMLAVAGVALAFYGWWEIQVQRGNLVDNPVADLLNRGSARLSTWIAEVGETHFATATAFVIGGVLVFALKDTLPRRADRRLLVGGFLTIYALVEFVNYRADLLVLPLLRTIADVPERVGNWFADPLRWPVLWEILLAVVLGAFAWLTLGRRVVRTGVDDPEPEPQPVGR